MARMKLNIQKRMIERCEVCKRFLFVTVVEEGKRKIEKIQIGSGKLLNVRRA
jgi:hypothetical protein